jgi:hypothetical protein
MPVRASAQAVLVQDVEELGHQRQSSVDRGDGLHRSSRTAQCSCR